LYSCVPFDNDAELARVLAKLGNVIVPATLEPILRRSPRYTAMVEELRKNVEVDEPELSARMRERGFEVAAGGLGDQFFLARREAILLRFADMKAGPDASFDRIRANLLPRTPLEVSTGVVHVVHDQ